MQNENVKTEKFKFPLSLFKRVDIQFGETNQYATCFYLFGVCVYKKAKINY